MWGLNTILCWPGQIAYSMGNSGRAGQLFAAAADAFAKRLLISVPTMHRGAQIGRLHTLAGFLLAWNPLRMPALVVLSCNDEHDAPRYGAIYFAHVPEKLSTLGACDPSV